jgi:hypothetical protein
MPIERRACWRQLHDPDARRRPHVDVFNKPEPSGYRASRRDLVRDCYLVGPG